MKSLLSIVICELREFTVWVLSCLPGKIGSSLRYLLAKMLFKECGTGVRIGRNFTVDGAENITIKDEVKFGNGCDLIASGGKIHIGEECRFNNRVTLNSAVAGRIIFGKKCIVGPNTIIRSANHIVADINTPIVDQGHEGGDIIIGNDVWIGAGVIILPNVKIEDGVIVAAGSVVSKSFKSNQVIAGVPARVIKERN